jgi:hypothetical protein
MNIKIKKEYGSPKTPEYYLPKGAVVTYVGDASHAFESYDQVRNGWRTYRIRNSSGKTMDMPELDFTLASVWRVRLLNIWHVLKTGNILQTEPYNFWLAERLKDGTKTKS